MPQEREGYRHKNRLMPFSVSPRAHFTSRGGRENYALKSIRAHYSLKTHYRQMRRTLFRVSYAYARFFELVFSITVSSECRVSRVFSAFM